MMNRYEGFLSGHDQTELFYQAWLNDHPRGTMVITHGLAEHSECYHDFALELSRDSWDIYAWDLRGHGRSEGKRGYASDFSDYEKDLSQFLQFVMNDKKSKGPFIVFGHSMGGLITLKTVIKEGADFGLQAVCLSSPALGLAVEVPGLKKKAAEWAARWSPRLTLHNEISLRDLVRDPDMVHSYEADPLRHDKISPKVYLGMMEGFEFMAHNAGKLSLPLFMQLAGTDRIVSTSASQALFESFGSKKKDLKIYPESYHEIFKDYGKEVAFDDLKKFINEL